MRLFDAIERIDRGPAGQAEPNFNYLNRSARSVFAKSRDLIESWFEKYPDPERFEFKGRFRSPLNEQHKAAFFELFLHEMLLKIGYRVELHPEAGTETEKRPDFLVKLPNGDQMFLEARLASGDNSASRAIDARLKDFYDSLNKVHSPDFFLAIQAHHFEPKTALPGKRIRNCVQKWLYTLDYEEIKASCEHSPGQDLPSIEFTHEDRRLKITAIPKNKTRGVSGIRPIGLLPGRSGWGGAIQDIKGAVEAKASRYKRLDSPYVVAVHTYNPLGSRGDEETALFGRDHARVFSELRDRAVTSSGHGVWTSSSGPNHTRVSGVLIVRDLYPWALRPTTAALYHNPWASKPLTLPLHRIGNAMMHANGLHYDKGDPIISILGLPDTWPGDDDMVE